MSTTAGFDSIKDKILNSFSFVTIGSIKLINFIAILLMKVLLFSLDLLIIDYINLVLLLVTKIISFVVKLLFELICLIIVGVIGRVGGIIFLIKYHS